MNLVLRTARLQVRTWQAADLAPLQAICCDAQVMQFVGDGRPWALDRTRQFIERASQMSRLHGYCQWPLISQQESRLIGFCGFVPADSGVEIGWRLAREVWGLGLATEAAAAVVRHGFTVLDQDRISATVQTRNQASLRVIAKLGMQFETRSLRHGKEVAVYAVYRRRRL